MSQSDFVSRGQALVAAGQFQEAVKVCRLGLLGRPTTVDGRVVLGQALLALKRFDEVLAEMRVALELDHSSVPAQALKGEALLRKGDTQAALETLHAARQLSPGDARILQLLAETEHGGQRMSTSHPAVGFLGSGDTKHYPNHPSGTADTETADSLTRPTSLSTPSSVRKSSQKIEAVEPSDGSDHMPSAEVLAVGDRSGTVEVDPELEGIEVPDNDFDELAAPPVAPRTKTKDARGGKQRTDASSKKQKRPERNLLDEDSGVETRIPVNPNKPALPSPMAAVRNSVQLPSGPLGEARLKPPTAPPPPFSQTIGALPPPPRPIPGTPMPPGLPPPRNPLIAAMPTVAALPQPPAGMSMAQQQTAAAVDKMFGADNQAAQPNWARATIAAIQDPRAAAAANEPTARPGMIDPKIAALVGTAPPDRPTAQEVDSADAMAAAAAAIEAAQRAEQKQLRKRKRKARSRLQIAMWVIVGVIVIGGGVFAGFQIRAFRLQKKIAAARDHASELAKADTWSGWSAARDSLAGIAQADNTTANRAALARARALLAYEFGDGLADTKPAVNAIAGGGVEASVAAAYVALAESDLKAARLAADAAIKLAPADPAALYVSGQATLLAGDAKAAVKLAKDAFDKEARPLYGVGLARAFAATNAWDDAFATLDRVIAGNADQPAAVIARADLLVASGRIAPGGAASIDMRAQLEKLLAEGKHPMAEQPHGVSPAQVAYGTLALARLDFARSDVAAALRDVNTALQVGLDDQRFAEAATETLLALGELASGQKAANLALQQWPASPRLRLALAQILLAQGRAADALDLLSKQADVLGLPSALAVRGQARLATGDYDGARADFVEALKKLPNLEMAVVGRAWLELANGDVDEARKLVEPRYAASAASGASPAIATAYAAVLRRGADSASRDKAKEILDKLVQGPPGPDSGRAHLELARLDVDLGDFKGARHEYALGSQAGNFEARLESALLLIDDRDPNGGRDTLDLMLKETGDHPPPILVIEAARARMLAGDHVGATQLLETAAKLPAIPKWRLERERGRLFLRRSDSAAATSALGTALDTCGSDAETFLLAADAATAEEKSGLLEKLKKLAPDRLKGRPEALIVSGKFLLAANKLDDAFKAYHDAKEALKTEKAAARRVALADYGLAVVAYNRQNDADALAELNLVINDDPSIYDAYLYKAEITKDKAQAFEQAKIAVRYNPDYPRAWHQLGKLAAARNDKKTLADAITKLGSLAPNGDELKELLTLKR